MSAEDAEDLAALAQRVAEFAAGTGTALVPAAPAHGCGPEVCLGPDDLDLPAFLELARTLGASVLYVEAKPFPGGTELPAHLAAHKGQTGEFSAAFMANGLVHFWERRTGWYLEVEEFADNAIREGRYRAAGDDDDDRLSDEERAHLADELATVILADPKFRAAAPAQRRRLAQKAIPDDANRWAGYDAIDKACNLAAEMTEAAYERLEDRLDELATQLLADPAYRKAASTA